MARIPRILLNREGESTVYHVMSRTALDGFPMKDLEKDYLVNLLKRFSGLYFVEVLGFCCMDNHFYFLIRMHSDSDYTDKEIQERFERFYAEIGDGKDFIDYEIPYLRKKLSSLSEFVREIKLGFSRFYNKRHHRIGFLGGVVLKELLLKMERPLSIVLPI